MKYIIGLIIVSVSTTEFLVGSYCLYYHLRNFRTLNPSKYSKIYFLVITHILFYLVIGSITRPTIFPTISKFVFLIISIIEIALYYSIAVLVIERKRTKILLFFLSIPPLFYIALTPNLSSKELQQEFLFLYVSIIYTFTSLKYFYQISGKSNFLINENQVEIYLQLGLLSCNALPMISSICYIGIISVNPSFTIKISANSNIILQSPAILKIFSIIGYSLLYYYIIKASKWTLTRFIQLQ